MNSYDIANAMKLILDEVIRPRRQQRGVRMMMMVKMIKMMLLGNHDDDDDPHGQVQKTPT